MESSASICFFQVLDAACNWLMNCCACELALLDSPMVLIELTMSLSF